MNLHDAQTAAEHVVIFGLDPLWLSTGLLIVSYIVLLSERINPTVVALLSSPALYPKTKLLLQ